MRRKEFRAWLCQAKALKESTASSRASNCATVEKYEGALDALFKHDQRQNRPPRHNIPINGNIHTGTATLRGAILLYQEFLAADSAQPLQGDVILQQTRQRIEATGDWPEWERPSSETVLKMVRMITPYIRFLHPDIVNAIVEDNEKNRASWCTKLIKFLSLGKIELCFSRYPTVHW